MKQVKIGDIWLVLIPKVIANNNKTQIDLEKRPCLIIDDGHGFIIEENRDYLGLKLTTKNGKHHKKINNWYDLGLNKESFVRIETPIKIEEGQLIHKIGEMSKYDLYIYLTELSDYINIDIIDKYFGEETKV